MPWRLGSKSKAKRKGLFSGRFGGIVVRLGTVGGGQVPDIGRELKGEGEAEGNALLGDTAALDLTREGLGCEGFAEEVGRGG